MNIQIFISFFLAFIGLVSAASNREICMKKNPRVISAIDIFCKNSGITAPSLYANTGVRWGPNGAQSPNNLALYITGSCSPPQWIPQQYCLSQFYSICATGGPRGMGSKKYGRNGCQKWIVAITKPGIKISPAK
ncbi:hypothetical protein AC578_3997 [Pseudocercospora eumusae]|uniref:Uncharacterized protein n=1 Tax=Pseudocercospora eumusae TaxID=321146 RepID=A0A139HLG8_9PEZI|nr:hypothetical protein AC578_3997 [Pseudocercospora eumusae]